jgi:hypothetical protein
MEHLPTGAALRKGVKEVTLTTLVPAKEAANEWLEVHARSHMRVRLGPTLT